MGAPRHFLDIVLVTPRRGFVHMTLREMNLGTFDDAGGQAHLAEQAASSPCWTHPVRLAAQTTWGCPVMMLAGKVGLEAARQRHRKEALYEVARQRGPTAE